MERDTAPKSLILCEEAFHLVLVSGENDNHAVALIFHFLDDRIDGLVSVKAVFTVDKRIGFVDEQDAAPRLLEFPFDLRSRPTDIHADKVAASALNERAAFQHSLFFQYFRQEPCNGGLRAARVTGEDHVHRTPLLCEPDL